MLKSLLFLLCILLSTFVLIYIFQRSLIYIPNSRPPSPIAYHAQDMKIISLPTKDNLLLNSWYKPARNNKPTLLYFHGNAGHIGNRTPLARQFLNLGFGVLLLEYRGFGGNKGRPSEQGLYNDGRAALNYLTSQGISHQQIMLYGESLGTAVATKMATEQHVCAVLLQSPFTSLSSLKKYHYPWLPLSPWDKFDSLERISKIKAPLLILHGKKDIIVPYSEAFILFEAAQQPKQIKIFPQSGHNDLWSERDFFTEVHGFIQHYCIENSG